VRGGAHWVKCLCVMPGVTSSRRRHESGARAAGKKPREDQSQDQRVIFSDSCVPICDAATTHLMHSIVDLLITCSYVRQGFLHTFLIVIVMFCCVPDSAH
jgi:hypothetical protein